MRRKAVQRNPPRCILDSGGVTALLGRSQRARAWLRWLATQGGEVVVPAVVLTECTSGDAGRDAEVNRILSALSVTETNEAVARLAGALRFRARTDDGIDALVAAEAAKSEAPSLLLTSDPRDLGRLLARHPSVHVKRV